jgi:hypothetical protein
VSRARARPFSSIQGLFSSRLVHAMTIVRGVAGYSRGGRRANVRGLRHKQLRLLWKCWWRSLTGPCVKPP